MPRKSPEISRALARYYKISLNRGEDIITLNEELRQCGNVCANSKLPV